MSGSIGGIGIVRLFAVTIAGLLVTEGFVSFAATRKRGSSSRKKKVETPVARPPAAKSASPSNPQPAMGNLETPTGSSPTPLSISQSEIPPADETAARAFPLDRDGQLLAREMSSIWTRDSDKLVSVIQQAVADSPGPVPVTMMLAIAHAETNGRILLVSEAGAVGLAQATPIAYLREGLTGPLFVTYDYMVGARAYILKKPLHDAEMVASMLLGGDTAIRREQARLLLNAAFKYRREGVEELEVLLPYAGDEFVKNVHEGDLENLRALEEVEKLMEDAASREALIAFRDRMQSRYRAMRTVQRSSWHKYQVELLAKRDELLRKHFSGEPEEVIQTRAYQASEMLARELDDRFSPYSMARFLNQHLQTKLAEAEELGVPEEDLERMTAGLYNGGGHNIKRMIAGLIGNLPETENYMAKVPATRRRLDQRLDLARITISEGREGGGGRAAGRH